MEGTIPAEFSIPEAYADKPYLKDVSSMDDVYKKLDGAQSLIGQKVRFLDDSSTDEERLSFYKSAGMPDKSEDYVFEKFGDTERDAAVDSKVKEIFHKAGVSGKAATEIQKGYEAFVNEAMAAKSEADDAAFDELSSKVLGDKADDILASSKAIIEENLPPELVDSFKQLPNSALVTMSSVVENIRQKYISEDSITPGQGVVSGKDEASLRAKGQELMNHEAFQDPMHPDHKKIVDEWNGIYQQVGKLMG